MPLNFVEFWNLILNRKSASDHSLEFYKWKIAFDKYKDCLPPYYNDYLNSYFKYLQIPQESVANLYLQPSERSIYEKNKNLVLIAKELRQR